MGNIEKYKLVFSTVFKVENEVLNDDFDSTSVGKWDSITQLGLVTAIEDAFDIMIDTEDILTFKGYAIGKEILSKYEVNF